MKRLLPLALLALCAPLRAATFVGADYGGVADLTPANGDTLSGTFTNVRLFDLAAGATVFVAPGVPLAVYASTISLRGTLDGIGRGQSGGNGGTAGGAGLAGFGAGPGGGGAAGKGGGGGAAGADGGAGSGPGAGAGGTAYGAAGAATAPLSADDSVMGSGGGGGGGNASKPGGAGGSGGASVYLEASSMTVSGSIFVVGSTASAVADGAAGVHPAAGGGGGGGTVVLRVTTSLQTWGAALVSASGGAGGNVSSFGGVLQPGGGGGGGRVKVYSRAAGSFALAVSTAGGAPGGTGGGAFGGNPEVPLPLAGAAGTVSFGRVAAAPSGLLTQTANVSSITWAWTATPDFGNAPAGSWAYRLFPSSSAAPLGASEVAAPSAALAVDVLGLTPNTTYTRFLTASSEWGDSLPSGTASTHTLANVPAGPAFSALGAEGLTFSWTAGVPANPAYTEYSVERATSSSFSPAAAQIRVALSSSPAGLTPNTSYFFRVRAVNLDLVPTDFTAALSTVTLAAVPGAAAFGAVHITSASLVWSAGANPGDTLYTAQVSTDNFFTLAASSSTLGTGAAFLGLTPGAQYFFRAFARNRAGTASAYSTVLSTRAGSLGDTGAPLAPGAPQADRRFSYDGSALYSWTAAQSPVGILDYHLLIGSTPGGSDFFAGSTTTLSYAAAGLPTGRTYYARVRARSNAGVYSDFSEVGAGLPVFITAQSAEIPKAFNWPNPFDPSQGPTQIGFYLEAPATVELKIYTLQGRPVYEESRRYDGAGNQVASWNGANGSGTRVAPGGYVVMIRKSYNVRVDVQKLKIAVLY